MSVTSFASSLSDGAAVAAEQAHACPHAIAMEARSTLSEIFAGDGRDAGAIGFALATAKPGPLLWVQDRMSVLETGRPYPPGLVADLVHVEARDAKAVLWTMEEGLRCEALGGVIGEIWGDPKALDFTATRRLAVAAEKHGVSATLVLFSTVPNLSGARMRWRVSSRPSPAHRWDDRAPGTPAWTLDLFKARGTAPGRWDVSFGGSAHEANGFGSLPRLGDGVLASEDGRSAA